MTVSTQLLLIDKTNFTVSRVEYCIVLYYIVLYWIGLDWIVLCCVVSCRVALRCVVLHCVVLYVFCRIVEREEILFWKYV